MRGNRVDGNHAKIVKALRGMGCSVRSLADVGKGCPDLLIGIRGKNLLAEVKDGSLPPSRKKLTPDEVDFFASWRGQVIVIESVDDAIKLVEGVK